MHKIHYYIGAVALLVMTYSCQYNIDNENYLDTIFYKQNSILYSVDSISNGSLINWSIKFNKNGTWSQYQIALNDSLYKLHEFDIAYDFKYGVKNDTLTISGRKWRILKWSDDKMVLINSANWTFYFTRTDTNRIGQIPPIFPPPLSPDVINSATNTPHSRKSSSPTVK